MKFLKILYDFDGSTIVYTGEGGEFGVIQLLQAYVEKTFALIYENHFNRERLPFNDVNQIHIFSTYTNAEFVYHVIFVKSEGEPGIIFHKRNGLNVFANMLQYEMHSGMILWKIDIALRYAINADQDQDIVDAEIDKLRILMYNQNQ